MADKAAIGLKGLRWYDPQESALKFGSFSSSLFLW